MNKSTWMWAIGVISIAAVIGIAALLSLPHDDVNDDRINKPDVTDLYVVEAIMTHGNDTSGGSTVTVYIGVENRGSISQSLDGCILRASVLYENVLMDKDVLTPNGTLEANDTKSHQFEFSADIPIDPGDEVRIWAALEAEDGRVLDTHTFDFAPN